MELAQAHARPAQVIDWIRGGWRIVHRRPDLWVGMAMFYLAVALALVRLPMLGVLLLALLSPVAAAGAVVAASKIQHSRSPRALNTGLPRPPSDRWRGPGNWARGYLLNPMQVLVQPLAQREHALGIVLLCVVCLGLVLAVKVAEYLLIGGSLFAGLKAPPFVTGLRPTMIVALVVVAALHLLLLMALLYIVPLTVLGRLDPIGAAAASFNQCLRNPVPVVLYCAGFAAVYVLLLYSFTHAVWLGYLLTFTLGSIALAAFVATGYCSYRQLFGGDQPLTGP